ncbi:MAG TPA: RDD family protein [Thermomicrobiales bacterium]|nr:RDD family protein [Thermomicrobiales bacterium]
MQTSAVPTTVGVGVGPRALAIIIDAVAIGIVSFILQMLAGGDSGAGTLVGCFFAIASLAYYPVMEKVYGASLGKMVMGLKVVTETGAPLDWTAAILRTLLRLIDGLFVYLIGAILVWTSPTNQRLGDKVARTLVVRKDQTVVGSSPTSRF